MNWVMISGAKGFQARQRDPNGRGPLLESPGWKDGEYSCLVLDWQAPPEEDLWGGPINDLRNWV